jgi:hypothetical protein
MTRVSKTFSGSSILSSPVEHYQIMVVFFGFISVFYKLISKSGEQKKAYAIEKIKEYVKKNHGTVKSKISSNNGLIGHYLKI